MSGRFDLNASTFDTIVGEIRLDGSLTLHGTHEAGNAITIDATSPPRDRTRAPAPWLSYGRLDVLGQMNITGSVGMFSTLASTPTRAMR